MKYVRLTDSKKRDARIQAVSPRRSRLGDYRNQQGEEVRSYRFINDTERHNPQNLIDQVSDMDELADRLIKEDPELDIEVAGRMIDQASQVWISGKGKVMHSARMMGAKGIQKSRLLIRSLILRIMAGSSARARIDLLPSARAPNSIGPTARPRILPSAKRAATSPADGPR